ncbi:MAG: SurA N-terminal domain-containing protein [Deltaproteobacteria bacterium]|nr:SurA N-terminal domain-containing protein [Deltaproteobacteria bacterium]
MLGLMRRHIGWGLKVILSIIIVTFVFFFGFNQLHEKSMDTSALQVGDESIPLAEFRLFYDNQLENIKATMKDGQIPDFLLKNIESSTQRQLVSRALMNQFATKLGMQVTNQELADSIVKQKDFDPVAYKNFISNFYNRFGLTYEDLIREDLLAQDFRNWVVKVEPVVDAKNQTQWTFETVTIMGENKKKLAEQIQSLWNRGKEATPLLKQNKLKADKIGPITLSDRGRLFQGQLSLDQYADIFGLSKPKSAPAKPFVNGKNFLVVRLVDIKKTTAKNVLPVLRVTDVWFDDFANKTKIVSHLKSEDL